MTVFASACVETCRVAEVTLAGVAYLAGRFDVNVITTGALDLAATMDAIAGKVPSGATERVYAWPVEDAKPPCAIVGYPDADITFDRTFGRGSDEVTIPLFFLVGKAHDRSARDRLSAVITGATGVKDAIDGTLETP